MFVQPRSAEKGSKQRVRMPSALGRSWSQLAKLTDGQPRYIKELADRIHSIEYKLGSEGGLNTDDVDRLFATSRPRNDDQSRKRPFFSISTGDASAPVQARLQPWGSDSRSLDPTSTSPDGQTFKNSSLAPKPSALKPDATPAKSATSENEGAVLESQEVPAIDEVALNE